jgi:hypothetical protein
MPPVKEALSNFYPAAFTASADGRYYKASTLDFSVAASFDDNALRSSTDFWAIALFFWLTYTNPL